MFDTHRKKQFELYGVAREAFITSPDLLIELEHFVTAQIKTLLESVAEEIVRDYNEASYLFPFWQNYPPDNRGRAPKGDQFPWIEVGEHAIGRKLARLLPRKFDTRDTGLPTGPDERFLITSREIEKCLHGITSSAFLFSDIKSVGPRDEADHAVMSHNQISGDGIWTDETSGVANTILTATGKRASHGFHCTIPPLYVLSNGTIAPVVQVVIKPIYRMLSLTPELGEAGQPIREIVLITVPNGLLLSRGPCYLKEHPGLFFPGKDDKTQNAKKLRARVDFSILKSIADWRIQHIKLID